MGMRIQGAEGTNSAQGAGMATWQQKQQSFKSLFSSLQSGDLGAAQTALKSLTGGSATVNGSSPLASIAQALQAGDLAGAQKAANEFQANRASRHHAHSSGATGTQPVAVAAGGAGSKGSLLNVTA
jgi:hypothetical protein